MRNAIRIVTVCVVSGLLLVAGTNDADARKGKQLSKEALLNPADPAFSSIFNWGLRLKNIKELILFAGHAAQTPDFTVQFPDMPVQQTIFILGQLDAFLAANGLDKDDIIRIEFTLTDDVEDGEFFAILDLFDVYFDAVEVKPAAGTLRFISRLAFPDMMVEYEIWMAQ